MRVAYLGHRDARRMHRDTQRTKKKAFKKLCETLCRNKVTEMHRECTEIHREPKRKPKKGSVYLCLENSVKLCVENFV